MIRGSGAARAGTVVLAVLMLAAGAAVPAQSQAPATGAAAKELASLLQAKKLEAIAARMPGEAGRFVAGLLVPNIQMIVISALHTRPMDTEYYLYNKDFKTAYMDLNSSALSTERIVIDDAMADGLIALPGKNLAHDSFVKDTTRQIFDGSFADPRKRNDKRIPQDAYMKAFAEAEGQYAKILAVLVAELKKPTPASIRP